MNFDSSLFLDLFILLFSPAFWLAVSIVFIIAAVLGYWFRGCSTHIKLSIKEANLKTQQIHELEKINRELESKNRELYAKELELVMANKRLQSLEAAKSKFISVTTHQLRTPLAAIKWTFDMAIKGQLGNIDEDFKKFMKKGFQSTERVISIVNDLLKIDTIDSEKSEFSFKPTNLVELVDNVINEFSNQIKSRQLEVVFEKPNKELPFLEMDEDKIRMVLENLIDNAIKYNTLGGKIFIKIDDSRLNSAESSLQITVVDSGIGIPSGEKDKVFQKFFRASNAIKQEPDGSGLGLYITREILEKHNGAIWFEEGKKGGSSFSFTLPLRQKKV
ncbi:MAG: HAMP domain-containing sensor histidine kinase [Candidatus Paceibacterota bacterium]|jgi:signal transduction histidine kinase